MKIKKLTLNNPDYPHILRNIPSPPKQLYYMGAPLEELLKRPRVAIVGSRKVSPYGEQVTSQLSSELAEQGVVIISGLAMGVDYIAHRAAVDADGLCIAVLPGPLDYIVPASSRRLAQAILDKGGVLVSEYPPGEIIQRQYFVARNRLVSGLADAVLITEASSLSGSRHTARFALEQGRDVMVIPGPIYSQLSVGTHNLIKRGQAALVTELKDILNIMHLEGHITPAKQVKGSNKYEQTLLDLLLQGVNDGEMLLERSGLTTIEYNQVLTMLEISSKIRPLGGNQWSIY